jgi:hypothetical protein
VRDRGHEIVLRPARFLGRAAGDLVAEVDHDDADDHINRLSHKYHGYDFKGYAPGQQRVKLYVEPERVILAGG